MNRAVVTMRRPGCRNACVQGVWRFAGWGAVFALVAVLVGLCGCTGPQVRSQSEDENDHEKYDIKTVGEVTDVSNAEPIMVGGIGLVVGLEGTGGSPAPGSDRTMIEDSLHKNQKLLDALLKQSGCRDLKALIDSPDTAVVRVSAAIPAGASRGDPLDVEVTVPPQSKATSLRGGYLVETVLYDYDSANHLSGGQANSDRILKGHGVAHAEGALLVGFGEGDEEARVKTGRIWGGGRSRIDRPFFLLMKGDQQLARVAAAVADRINESLHASSPGPGGDVIATAENKQVVYIKVPPQYRHNLPRFLRVVRMVPLRDTPEKQAANAPPRVPYRQRLEEDVANPVHTVTAALRLEALGHNSAPALLRVMKTSQHPLVRFCTAEALAYLSEPAAGPVLAEMVEDHAVLRAFSLTALASLNQGVCHVKLRELLASPNPETRYGAFRALRVMDEDDEAIAGELLNNSFWLHRVAVNSPPMVHISSSKRAEVVLFGDGQCLVPPFSFRAGEYTFVAGNNDTRCTVSRFSPQTASRATRQCSLGLDDVLKTLAALRGGYPEAVELLRQANSCQCLTCRVEADRLPQAVSVYELARSGKTNDPDLVQQDAEILDAKPDLGSTPTLYERTYNHRPRGAGAVGQEALRDDR